MAEKEEAVKHRKQKLDERYNRTRKADDSRYRKFRASKSWRETSKAKLRACEWKCEAKVSPSCTGLACEVHHIKPLRTEEGWNRRLDWSNLMGVCIACHNIIDGKNFGRKKDDAVIDLRKIQR